MIGAPPLTLLVAGPKGDGTSRWGDAFALAMEGSFPGDPVLRTHPVGGLDGVTGANQLDALVVPDGRTAAILPGAALNAWLVGDSRVHFDPTRWVPLMIGCNSGVLVVRRPKGAASDLASLRAMSPLRLAVYQPESNDLAALLALARMGVPMAPVFGLRDSAAKTRAFLSGEVDAVFLAGEGVPEDVAPLTAGGGVPVFCLGGITPDGASPAIRCFPDCRMWHSFSDGASGELDAAFRAAAMAARTDFLAGAAAPQRSESGGAMGPGDACRAREPRPRGRGARQLDHAAAGAGGAGRACFAGAARHRTGGTAGVSDETIRLAAELIGKAVEKLRVFGLRRRVSEMGGALRGLRRMEHA